MTDIEIVKNIIRSKGKCPNVGCQDCPLDKYDRCYDNNDALKLAKKWLEENHQEDIKYFQADKTPLHIKSEGHIGKFDKIYDTHKAMLCEKNRRYGDSALEPVNIFAKVSNIDSILIRLDDKISRVKNSSELRKNDVSDILGYLILLCKAKGWEDFMDQVD